MQETVIVVPCYNEAGRLTPEPFFELCRQQPAISFVFVDDGSTDDTFARLSELSARAPQQISVLKLDQNSGKAEAVRRGVLRAFESSAQFIGFWDADLATPLYNIEPFSEIFERDDVELVIGSRVMLLGRHVQRDVMRHYAGRGFATIAAFALGLSVYDTQCGAKMFRNNQTFRRIFSEPFELDWSFDVELLSRLIRSARQNGRKPERLIVEVPLAEWIDAPGSKLRPSHYPRIAFELCRMFAIARKP